jgi:hypothetical protein
MLYLLFLKINDVNFMQTVAKHLIATWYHQLKMLTQILTV